MLEKKKKDKATATANKRADLVQREHGDAERPEHLLEQIRERRKCYEGNIKKWKKCIAIKDVRISLGPQYTWCPANDS